MTDVDPGERPPLEKEMAGWAAEAAGIAMQYYRRTGDLVFKYGQEAVTEADGRIEAMLRERIAAAYPDDGICGEEMGSGPDAGAGARTWHLDPIDGTLNFALGLPGFCISIALFEGERPVAACIMQPAVGDLFTATEGRGACLNGRPIRVSQRDSLAAAVVSTQLKKDGRVALRADMLQALQMRTMKLRKEGAIALELAWTAAGSYDALLASFAGTIHIWDAGAGLLLVQEAGGVVTDLDGRPYTPGGGELLASNGLVHRELLDLVAAPGRPQD